MTRGTVAILSALGVASGVKDVSSFLQARIDNHEEHHFWSTGRGNLGSYSASSVKVGIQSLKHPTWTWHHEAGLWGAIGIGTNIDNQRNIIFTTTDGVRKFSPDGRLLWENTRSDNENWHDIARFKRTNRLGTNIFLPEEEMSKACALMGDAVYGITDYGRAFALDLATGKELWSNFVTDKRADGNNGQVVADSGVVIVAAEASTKIERKTPICCGPANHKIFGVNSTSGEVMWRYTPEIPVWNFGAAFAGDGTFIYQDIEGTAHRNRVSDGSLVWKNGGVRESWTDGQANLGSNGVVYAVSNYGSIYPNMTGCITAHRLSDGKVLWRHDVPKSPNSIPAVGRLAGREDLSVVIPVGQNDQQGARIDVIALNAETGEEQWVFEGPTQKDDCGTGDALEEARIMRARMKIRQMTMPNSWGTPAIDSSGTVFVGGTTGAFFALRDADGDGSVKGHGEVDAVGGPPMLAQGSNSTYTPADFVGGSGPAVAPGLMAVGNSNSLTVWRF